MKIEVRDDTGKLVLGYETGMRTEQICPAIIDIPPILDALTTAVEFLELAQRSAPGASEQ